MDLLVKRALDHAALWHKDQRRKYPGLEVPYFSHPAGVALLLGRHGFGDEVIAAGALHDVLEDCGVSFEELERLFGVRVAELVRAVSEPGSGDGRSTENDSQSWEERKAGYLERFAREAWEAQAIGIADKIDNFESILVSVAAFGVGPTWAMFKRGREAQLARFDAIGVVLAKLPRHPLIRCFEERLSAVRALG